MTLQDIRKAIYYWPKGDTDDDGKTVKKLYGHNTQRVGQNAQARYVGDWAGDNSDGGETGVAGTNANPDKNKNLPTALEPRVREMM